MHQALFLHYRGSSSTRFSPGTCAFSCVDGPRLARDHLACSAEVACSHVSGLLVQSGWTAGPDGVREPSPHHSNGIDVPMNRQASLGCVGSTDCAISVIALSQAPALALWPTEPPQPRAGILSRAAPPPRRAIDSRFGTVSLRPLSASWRHLVLGARLSPAGIEAAVPTREPIGDACAYHDLAKLDLTTAGSNLTRPFIAATGGHDNRIPLLNRFANADKRLPDHGL